MKKFLFVKMGVLLILISFGCSKTEESDNHRINSDSCIFGTIVDSDVNENFVLIKNLNMPEEKYEYIRIVVVPKDEFPFHHYQIGDIIIFKIVDVKYAFPINEEEFSKPMHYLCSIELCK